MGHSSAARSEEAKLCPAAGRGSLAARSTLYRGFISHSGLEFPRPDTLDQYLTRRSAWTWAHGVTPDSDEPGPAGGTAGCGAVIFGGCVATVWRADVSDML